MGLQRAGGALQVYTRPFHSGLKRDFFSSLLKSTPAIASAEANSGPESKRGHVHREWYNYWGEVNVPDPRPETNFLSNRIPAMNGIRTVIKPGE